MEDFCDQTSAPFSSSTTFAKFCHLYLLSYVPLKSFPFPHELHKDKKYRPSQHYRKGVMKKSYGKRVCRRNSIFFYFFHTSQVLQEIASRSLDEKTLFKSQELQFEGYPFPRPISCHSARTLQFPLEQKEVYFTVLIWCGFVYPVCANPNLAPTLCSKC